ncbi:hypothetical protein QFC21_006826 [Naganishia friedmannii]|uniref:Uncharacterized protein n=1 Tax=Naganishia friedmannii TaxID=89922 RepID=A0ACC2V0C2_9TREE|nr:hypothetical protein QFC21_006826 [Naganishia friedmannii]
MFFLSLLLLIVIALASSTSARPASLSSGSSQWPLNKQGLQEPSHDTPRPLVIWHGLGHTATSEGISGLVTDIKEMYPGIYVHSVQVPSAGSIDDERKAGFYGNASSQVDIVAETLREVPELTGGFDAIGFSQGGLFMRDYVQRYNHPPVRNLLTFGSPHMGVARLIPCRSSFDLVCIIAKRTAERGVYTEWAQNNLIQASYFRDHDRLDVFHEMNNIHALALARTSRYLTRLNGELEAQPLAADNIGNLSNFVMVNFEQDQTIYPKDSSTFGSLTPTRINTTNPLIPLVDNTFLWKHDHIGLKRLAEKKALHYGTAEESCPGAHMDLEWENESGCGRRLVQKWIGSSL